MYTFISLDDNQFTVRPETKILKSADYMHYVEADSLIEIAKRKVDQMEQEAQQIIADAHEQADKIRADAHKEYEEQKENGYQVGLDESRTKHAYEINKTVALCNEYLLSYESSLIDIVLQSITKLIGRFDDSELTERVVKEGLKAIRSQKQIVLKVAVDQVSTLQERMSVILADYPDVGYVDVVGDARLTTGDCVLETDIGVVDSSITGQLTALTAALKVAFKQYLEEKAKVLAESEEEQQNAETRGAADSDAHP